MKVSELIELLQQMPQNSEVEVNDNDGCNVFPIHSVDNFPVPDPDYPEEYPVVVIQVNVD